MTQGQLNQLATIKGHLTQIAAEREELNERYRQLSRVLSAFEATCDHLNPDGSTALDPEYGVCLICYSN